MPYWDQEWADYRSWHDGNLWAGLKIPLNKYLSLTPKVQYSLPLSTGADAAMQAASFDGGDSQFVYGGLILDLNFPGCEKPAPCPPPPPPPPPPAAPKDSDGDGVVDPNDQCPGTPRGCTVDARGCHLDSDGDGVCDGIDQCPDTPKGVRRLDEKGCSPISAVGIHFEFDKATILPRSYPELDQFVKFLKDNPKFLVEIQGHTDSKGTADYNQKLSEKRAEAVRDYFISKGVPASQMITKGYGMTRPIADNATEEGRTMNRRIEYWRVTK